jgi:hypothetical protein
MSHTKSPTLAMLFPLASDAKEFKKFRDGARNYLKEHGIPERSPVFKLLTGVSRGGTQSRDSLGGVVDTLLAETGNGDTGPRGKLDTPLPLLSAFHRKYIADEPVEWGAYVSVREALLDELYDIRLVW